MTSTALAEPTAETESPAPASAAAGRKAEAAERVAARRRVLGPVRGTLIGAGVLQFVAALANVIPFLVVVEIARELLGGAADPARVWGLVLMAVVGLGLRVTASALALFWTHVGDARYGAELRALLAAKFSRLPLGWFTARSAGSIKKYLQDDIGALHYLVAHSVLDAVSAITVPVVSMVYLFVVDWRLAVIVLLPLLGYVAVLSWMMRGNEDKMREYAEWSERINARAIEFVDGIQVVRVFGQARRAHHRYQEAVDEFSRFFIGWVQPMTRAEAASAGLLNPVTTLFLVMGAGALFVSWGWIEPITILPFVFLGLGLGAPVMTIGHSANGFRQAGAAATRLVRALDEPELPSGGTAELAPLSDARRGRLVEFRDVRFEYRSGRAVLDGVDLRLEPGTITALVGPSGAGKSTLATLLPRFFDPTGGAIALDGVDLRSLPPEALYREVGFVFQEVRLLRATVRDNIALARPEASLDEVRAAARAARIHDRILALPRGYDSVIGEDARLSGGEGQRLSIARALLADTPVLVLEEATASVDPESESAIQEALSHLVQGRTVLVIAHRLATIVDVDRIVILEDGRVTESGTHERLLAAGGRYERLWRAEQSTLAGSDDAPGGSGEGRSGSGEAPTRPGGGVTGSDTVPPGEDDVLTGSDDEESAR